MKFLSLEMPAFGPFTDFRLELPEEPSFHVLYGPNESGKSSTLRAIRGLLYGIDRRSCDNFLHQYTEMRIGGTLKHSDGRQLHLFRRKGNKQTLLSPQGEPLAEEVLSGFLGGLPPELFDRLYGLDHVSLVSGARVLLAEGGKVGESLFAASVGPQFRELLSQLAEEAKELWGPRSSTRLVNRSLKQWRESQEKVRQASLSAATWDQVFQELETMQQREGELAGEIRQLDTEIRMRRRWQKAAPLVSHRQDLQRELAEFAGIPQLSSDFSERRAQVLTELDRGKQQLKWSSENQASLKASLDALPEAWPVLALRSQIEGLEQRLGLIQESRRALPLVQRELTSLEKRRQRLLSDLGYNQTSLEAIPDAPVRVRTRRLVARYQTLQQQLQHDNEARKRSEERLGEIRSELARLRPFQQIQTLEQGLRRAQKQLVLDSRLEELARLQPEQSSRTRALLSKLPFRGGSEQLQELKVPQRQTVRAFETRFLDATRALERTQLEVERLTRDSRLLSEEMELLASGEEIPSRVRLQQLREQRQQAWTELRQEIEQGGSPGEKALDRYEELSDSTESYSDQMWESAALVASLEKLGARFEVLAEHLKEARTAHARSETRRKSLQEEWEELWDSSAVSVRSPREMEAWLESREQVLESALEERRLAAEGEVAQQKRKAELEKLGRLWAELESSPFSVTTVGEALERLEAQLTPVRESNLKRPQLEAELSRADDVLEKALVRLEESEEELADWRQEWQEVLSRYALPEEPTPTELEQLLEKFEELEELERSSEKLLAQQARHKAELSDFESEVEKLRLRLEQGDEATLLSLRQLLDEATLQARKRDELSERMAELRVGARETQFRLEEVSGQLSALLAEAEVETLEELRRLEPKLQRRHELQIQLAAKEESLRQLSGASALDDFCSTVRAADVDALASELERMEQQKSRAESERDQALARIGELRRDKELMDGTVEAAEAAQNAAQDMAEGRQAVRAYMRLALAESVLRREIERYRKENEGPVLRAASGYFSRLTCGAYRELETGYDEKHGPVLLCVARSGRRVRIEGLSDGTRDQLFLALRLATIQQSAQGHEPLPLIADDLLVHFDSDRAEATLSVLSEFAAHTQVLLFTHLSRDRELAQGLPRGSVRLTELSPTAL